VVQVLAELSGIIITAGVLHCSLHDLKQFEQLDLCANP
jgi:hypothetical protein